MKCAIQINLIWLYPMTSTSNSSLLWFQKQDFTESSFNHELQWEHYRSYLIKQILLCVFFCDTVLCFQIEPKIGPIDKCNFLDFWALFIYTLFCLSTCPFPFFPTGFRKTAHIPSSSSPSMSPSPSSSSSDFSSSSSSEEEQQKKKKKKKKEKKKSKKYTDSHSRSRSKHKLCFIMRWFLTLKLPINEV